MTVAIVDQNGRIVTHDPFAKVVELQFGAVIGHVWGPAETAGYPRISTNLGSTEAVDLLEWTEQYATVARPFDPTMLPEPESITEIEVIPVQTRWARVATFSTYIDADGQPYSGGGFIDPADEAGVILVFVDRPSVMHGKIEDRQWTTVVDIVIPEQGFHWLKLRNAGMGESRLMRVAPLSEVTFTLLH